MTNKVPKNNNNNNWSAPLWLDGSARNWIGLTSLLLTDAQPERNSQRLATSETIRLTHWKTTYTAKLFFFPWGLFPTTTTTSSETCWHAWENILLCWDAELAWFFPAILGGHRKKYRPKPTSHIGLIIQKKELRRAFTPTEQTSRKNRGRQQYFVFHRKFYLPMT